MGEGRARGGDRIKAAFTGRRSSVHESSVDVVRRVVNKPLECCV